MKNKIIELFCQFQDRQTIGVYSCDYPELANRIIELFRTERLTDEQIDAMFPESMVERYYTQRQAARQVRDLLQGEE